MSDALLPPPPPGPPQGADPTPEQALAAAVALCPDVAGLSGGSFGEVATYLPGRSVTGVRLLEDSIEVHVIARLGTPLPSVAAQVRIACAPFAHGRHVDVTIDDVVPEVGDHGPDAGDRLTSARSTHHTTP